MSRCKEVMTHDPICCHPAEPVTRAAALMRDHDVGSIPVVESSGSKRLVGIVTDRDLVVKVLAKGHGVEAATVGEAMTSNPTSCGEDEDVERAVQLMKERQVRRMPIVDGGGSLVGIIAQADIATRIDRDAKTGELVEAISESGTSRR